jgi:hypothetical protein
MKKIVSLALSRKPYPPPPGYDATPIGLKRNLTGFLTIL